MAEESTGGGSTKELTKLVVMLVAMLGVGGGGSYMAANSAGHTVSEDVKTEIKSELSSLSAKLEAHGQALAAQGRAMEKMDERLDQVVVLGQQVDSLRRQLEATQDDMDELKRELKDKSQGERLTQLQLELQRQLSEISDRITRLEAAKVKPPTGDK